MHEKWARRKLAVRLVVLFAQCQIDRIFRVKGLAVQGGISFLPK